MAGGREPVCGGDWGPRDWSLRGGQFEKHDRSVIAVRDSLKSGMMLKVGKTVLFFDDMSGATVVR